MSNVVEHRSPPATRSHWRFAWAIAALAALIASGIVFRAWQLRSDPHVFYLPEYSGAEWIRVDEPFFMTTFVSDTSSIFSKSFTTFEPVEDAQLVLRAFRRCIVELDGRVIYESPAESGDWTTPVIVPFPQSLPAGPHFLKLFVMNSGARSCVWASSPELGLHTSPQWLATSDGLHYRPTILASDFRPPEQVERYPRASDGFWSIAPWVAVVFVVCFAWSAFAGPHREGADGRWRIPPSAVRWGLVGAWLALAVNNIWRLPSGLGFDVQEHLRYVQFIVERRTLPLATDGWQMFQSPLFYLLASPWYAVLKSYGSGDAAIKVLRFLPLLCGLAQIEVVYRAARCVFPRRDDLQTLATLIGGLLPMHIYIAQVIGNEPLAGCLTAVVLLLCFGLLAEASRPRSAGFFVALGVVWGLALLSKVTPVLLTPVVFAAVILYGWTTRANVRATVRRLALVALACGATSGWYYARNWRYLGKPFAGGWDRETNFAWWQDPSYRTWNQLTSFGAALDRPTYSGLWSLWDALYSSLWLDAFTSGNIFVNSAAFPWRPDWMAAGAWLGLVPSALIAASLITVWLKPQRAARSALLLSMAAVAVYLAAVVDLFVRLPIYTTAKATYMVGLLPCFALLAAAGAAPLLRWRWTRAAVFAAVACWAAAAYAAYFSAL